MTLAQALPLATTWSMPGDGGMGTGWGIVMMIGMTLFWLAIIAIPVLVILGSRRDWTGGAQKGRPRSSTAGSPKARSRSRTTRNAGASSQTGTVVVPNALTLSHRSPMR